MENLTRENFWNHLQQLYPDAMAEFCEWIDLYKVKVNWERLFSANESTMQLQSSKYKFHELPGAMQLGVWLQYMLESQDVMESIPPIEVDFENFDLRECIEGHMECHQAIINAGREATQNAD